MINFLYPGELVDCTRENNDLENDLLFKHRGERRNMAMSGWMNAWEDEQTDELIH